MRAGEERPVNENDNDNVQNWNWFMYFVGPFTLDNRRPNIYIGSEQGEGRATYQMISLLFGARTFHGET